MASDGRKKGCQAPSKTSKPKAQYETLEDARAALRWMADKLGMDTSQMRPYECRYSPPGDPHFHNGHKPKEAGADSYQNRGRMPAKGRRWRR